MKYRCPACRWPHLHQAPRVNSCGASYEICPCCGFQSGVSDDDDGHTPAAWRAAWIGQGMPWWSTAQHAPPGWDAAKQMTRGR